jgi:hypothetical protein
MSLSEGLVLDFLCVSITRSDPLGDLQRNWGNYPRRYYWNLVEEDIKPG